MSDNNLTFMIFSEKLQQKGRPEISSQFEKDLDHCIAQSKKAPVSGLKLQEVSFKASRSQVRLILQYEGVMCVHL